MKNLLITLFAAMLLISCGQNKNGNTSSSDSSATTSADTTRYLSDQDISDAYVYLLGRDIILKQERLDFEKEGFQWNKMVYRTPGGVAWANPNLDVAYSEAWIAVDENTAVLLEIPKITGRYYTYHVLNGWGETVLNINERTFPQQPFGKYALCLKGSNPKIPSDALRVDLPAKTSRVLARVELGDNMKEAVRLQKQFVLTSLGEPKIEKPFEVPLFEGIALPGVEIFDSASAMLATEPDINEGMESLQEKVKAVESLVKSGSVGRSQVEKIITDQARPALFKKVANLGLSKNGWIRPEFVGNYHNDFFMRTLINLIGLWANNNKEATYFGYAAADGSTTYTMTFPKDALPKEKAKYFWSVIAVDAIKYQVLPNSLNRYLLNKESGLKYNKDGSLTLVFGPKPLAKYPTSNWLPAIAGQKYNLTFRFYGPSEDVISGQYFPPELVKENL
jgi:hypothetical protein